MDTEGNGSSRNLETGSTKPTSAAAVKDSCGEGTNGGDQREEKTTTNGDVFIIDVKSGSVVGRSRKSENSKEEKVCRICHFGTEGELELIPLGCDCKGELGSSHLHCAETWFSQKGDRLCEICGKTAKNIRNNVAEAEETSIFMMEWNEMRLMAATIDAANSRERSRRSKRSLCNLVLAFLVIAFLLLWFFRGIKILQ